MFRAYDNFSIYILLNWMRGSKMKNEGFGRFNSRCINMLEGIITKKNLRSHHVHTLKVTFVLKWTFFGLKVLFNLKFLIEITFFSLSLLFSLKNKKWSIWNVGVCTNTNLCQVIVNGDRVTLFFFEVLISFVYWKQEPHKSWQFYVNINLPNNHSLNVFNTPPKIVLFLCVHCGCLMIGLKW